MQSRCATYTNNSIWPHIGSNSEAVPDRTIFRFSFSGFTRLIELFDQYDVSFVSITQEAIMRGSSPLSSEEWELIAVYVSGLNACNDCFGVHTETAYSLGFSEGTFEKLLEDPTSAPIVEKMKPLLAYVKKLTLTSATLSQKDVNAVFVAEWGEAAVHDAVLSAALFNFINRLLEGHGIKGSDAIFKARGSMLAEHGYAGPVSAIAGTAE